MVEENEKKDVPSKEELEKINKEIAEKEKQSMSNIKKEVKDEVKKEMETEQTIKELKDKLLQQEEDAVKRREEAESRLKEIQDKLTQEIEDIKGARQAPVKNENPFIEKDAEGNEKGYPIDVRDEKVIKDVEEESRKKFIEERRLPPEWGRPQNT